MHPPQGHRSPGDRSPEDREREVYGRFLLRRSAWLRQIEQFTLDAEHSQLGDGDPSPVLQSVLVMMRQEPVAGKLALLRRDDGRLEMLRLSGVPGVAHEVLTTRNLRTAENGRNKVFQRRLLELAAEAEER